MAKFKYKHAVMSAGKSQELARVHYNYKIKNQKVVVLVPTTDNRSGVGYVTARSGEKISAIAVNPGEMKSFLKKDFPLLGTDIVCVLIDEAQFFEKEDIVALKETLVVKSNIPVIAYGLKVDFRGDLFEGSAACLAVAEEIIEIETVCAYCNSKAIMNLRFFNGKPTRKGEQVLIGDNEYRQVCHKHHLDESLEL